MKNNKGTTLVETVMAIFILSTAGIIILTGIATVIRVMGDANTVKNQSDVLLSKAEKTDTDLSKEVKESPSDLTASITNGKGKSLNIKYKITQYDMKNDGEIALKSIRSAKATTVEEEFPDIVKNANSFYLKVTDYANLLSKSSQNMEGANYIFNGFQPWKDGKYLEPIDNKDYIRYPKEILPKQEQATPYFLKAFYPWEHVMLGNINPYNVVIYLSKFQNYEYSWEQSNISSAPKEFVHFVYDFEDRCWYYNADDAYELVYAPVYIWTGTSGLSYKKGEVTYLIRSWNEVKSHLRNTVYGWKKLDMDAKYNASSPDDVWK